MQRAGICLETKVACRAPEQQANSVLSKWQKRKRSRASGRSCTARQFGGIEGGLKVLHGKRVKLRLRQNGCSAVIHECSNVFAVGNSARLFGTTVNRFGDFR